MINIISNFPAEISSMNMTFASWDASQIFSVTSIDELLLRQQL